MKKRQIPHTYAIIFHIILFCAALTWIIPGGQYKESINAAGEKTVVYEAVEHVPQTWQVFSAFYKGFVDKADMTDNTDQFAKVLEQFQNEDNYPILISCSYGKDRTGFLTAMLLAALDIPRDAIMEDYLTSNQYIDTSHLADIVKHLSTDAQESITVFLTANEGLMDLAFHKIKKEYGSTEKYLSKGLRLTDKKRERLKDILLY